MHMKVQSNSLSCKVVSGIIFLATAVTNDENLLFAGVAALHKSIRANPVGTVYLLAGMEKPRQD